MGRYDTPMSPDTVRELDAYQLSRLADCGRPDSLGTEGAEFLRDTRDRVLEAFDERVRLDGMDSMRDWRVRDDVSQGGAPIDSNDHAKWSAFVDLEAYKRSPEGVEHCHTISDMADLFLADIFDTLVSVLTTNLCAWADEQEEESTDDANVTA